MFHFSKAAWPGRVQRWCALALVLGSLAGSSLAQSQATAPAEPGVFRVAVPGNLFARLGKTGAEGPFLETMDTVLKRMGKTPQYVIMPTGDALAEVTNGTISAATVVVPSAKLSETMWLSEPLVTESNIVLALKEKVFPLKSLANLQGKRIGARQGYRYPLLENKSGTVLQRYSTDGEMLRALLFGQVDVILCSAISDIFALRSEGIMKRLVVLDKAVGSVPLVATFSKKHFTAADLDAFNSGLAEFKKSPQWKQVLERNGLADLSEPWAMIAQ